jgi:hypothetical protein
MQWNSHFEREYKFSGTILNLKTCDLAKKYKSKKKDISTATALEENALPIIIDYRLSFITDYHLLPIIFVAAI